MQQLTDKQFTLVYRNFVETNDYGFRQVDDLRVARNLVRKRYLRERRYIVAGFSTFAPTDKGIKYLSRMKFLFTVRGTCFMTTSERRQYVLALDPYDSFEADALYQIALDDRSEAIRFAAMKKLSDTDKITAKGYEPFMSDSSERIRVLAAQGALAA